MPEYGGTIWDTVPEFSYDYPAYTPTFDDPGLDPAPVATVSTPDDAYDFLLGVGDRVVNFQSQQAEQEAQLVARRGTGAAVNGNGFDFDLSTVAIIFAGLFLLSAVVK